jgi:hypothetical protein
MYNHTKMSEQQTSNAPTNAESRQPVSFENVSLDSLRTSFNDTYKVSKGSASQLVLGFQSMSSRLQEPTNEYQSALYPKLKDLCARLSTKYTETFLTSFSSDVERQVFGANLNGNRNNGSLYRAIPSGVNRNLTYNYAQFGQLMRVLTNRLRFVTQRDATSVERYRNSTEELQAYQKLQSTVTSFLGFLADLSNEWNQLVTETRTRLPQTEQQREQRQPRQFQQRESRDSREQRQPRPSRQESTPQTTRQSTRQSTRQTTQPTQPTQQSGQRQSTRTAQSTRTNQSGEGWTTQRRRTGGGGTQTRTRNTVTVQ